MIQSLRQIKTKIRNVENVKKVTHAMEMIATAKFRSIENNVVASREYLAKVEMLLHNLLQHRGNVSLPLLKERENQKRMLLCVISSDAGLCSTYNSDIIRRVEDFIRQEDQKTIELVVVGKKGFNYFKKRGIAIRESFIEYHGRYSQELACNILNTLTECFILEDIGSIWLAYTHFETVSRHKVKIEKFFPFDVKKESSGSMLFEPNAQKICEDLIAVFVLQKIKSILLESFACEHAARMMAMGVATSNAKDLLEDMILLRNKVRQANITKEILEISSTAEVLR